jgi:hypothetical protein
LTAVSLQVLTGNGKRGRSRFNPTILKSLPLSGPKYRPDCPYQHPIRARIGLRFKTSPNQPYFGNRTK